MKIDISDCRFIERLTPEARLAVDTALRSTVNFILGMRDGSCYRYEDDIKNANEIVHRTLSAQRRES